MKAANGKSLLKHRRHTFVKGMVIAAKSANGRKILQELLNSCIRGRCENNNNSNVEQFISALKKILLHASITASKYANCLEFETDSSPPIFSLKWSKNRSAISRQEEIESPPFEIGFLDEISEHKENGLAYIAGYIIRGLLRSSFPFTA